MGGTTIIAVESVPARIEMARQLGADHVVDFRQADPVAEIRRLADGRGLAAYRVATIILSMKSNQRAVPGCRCYLAGEFYGLPYSPRVLVAV